MKKIAELEKNLEIVEHRIQFYDEACAVYAMRDQLELENVKDRA